MGESTRKNPDKYIEQLKATIERQDTYIGLIKTSRDRAVLRLIGVGWFDGNDTNDDFVIGGIDEEMAQEAYLNQAMIINAEIVGYCKDDESISVRIIDVSLKETL